MTSQLPPTRLVCDADSDGDIDSDDINLIAAARNQPASGADDPRDPDRDGRITVVDLRTCSQKCTRANCANNGAPSAHAGPDQTVAVASTVQLSGAGSSDPDGDPLTYQWTLVSKPAGSNAALSAPTSVNPTLVIDVAGSYVVQLVVHDGKVASAPDEVRISTENSRPIARAGPAQSVKVGEKVVLDASASSDADGDALTFRWELIQRPSGSAAVLSAPNAVNPSFVADLPGQYVASLIVNDGKADSLPSQVTITTVNSAPVANAGPDQKIHAGTTVTLSGAGSTDVDGNALTYAWSFTSRPAGSKAVLSSASSVTPSFVADVPGSYVVQLIVNDGQTNSAPDTVVVTSENVAPVANAGTDQSVALGAVVTLDGCGSTDADGDALSFSWALTTRPEGSSAALSNPIACNPTFVADRPGNYVAQLTVNDGFVGSTPDTVTISTSNSVPIGNAGADRTANKGDVVQLDGCSSSDPDGNPLTYAWTFTTRPTGSSASLSNPAMCNPTFTADQSGNYVVQLIVNDGTSNSAPDTVLVTVNDAVPVANADSYSTAQGTPLTIAAPGVLGNDTAAPGKTLSAQLVSAPAGGQGIVTLEPTGAFTFTPATGFSGTATFTYRASDGTTQSNVATVSIAVQPVTPQPPRIDTVTPSSGEPGVLVTITGANFNPVAASNSIAFGAAAGVIPQSATATQLTIQLPSAAQTGPVSVTTPAGTAVGPAFTVVRPEDFAVSVNPGTTAVIQSTSVGVTVSLASTGKAPFTGLANLTVTGLPAGVTVTMDRSALTAGQMATLTLTASSTAAVGKHAVQIQATGVTSGLAQTRTATLTLEVQANSGSSGIRGRFLASETGTGVANVIVRVGESNMTQTDAAGNFLLTGLPAGVVTLRMDATPANPQYPIWPQNVFVEDGKLVELRNFYLTKPPTDDKFKPLQPASGVDQIITDDRFPGLEVKIPAGVEIIGYDKVRKTRIAVDRIPLDRLPAEPPPMGARSVYQLFFGTPMGGVPTGPIQVTYPNDLGLAPGQKAELWYYDGVPDGAVGEWRKGGTGTVSNDGKQIVTDADSGIPRFCGVCGLSCFIPSFEPPNPPCTKCRDEAGLNPVTLALGLELSEVTDWVIDGVMPIVISRSYHPFDPFIANANLIPSMGRGWSFGYDWQVFFNGAVARMIIPGNQRVNWTPTSSGEFEAPTDLRFGGARLFLRGSDLVLQYKDGSQWIFRQHVFAGLYWLVEQHDANGNRLVIERDGAGRPTTIRAPGRIVSIGKGVDGFITHIRDATGREVSYSYNSDDRIAIVRYPDQEEMHYTYIEDQGSHVNSFTSSTGSSAGSGSISTPVAAIVGPPPAHIRTIKFPGSPTQLVIDYGPNFRVQRQRFGELWELTFAYELSGTCAMQALQLNSRGEVIAGGRCAGPGGPTVDSIANREAGWRFLGGTLTATTVTDANGNSYTIRFNSFGLRTEFKDALGQITTYERDSRNRLVRMVDPLGRETRYEYDGNSNVTRIVDPAGRATDFTYHPRWNRVTSITRKLDDGHDVKYQFEYDERSPNPLRTIDPLGNVTAFTYSSTTEEAIGLVKTVTDPNKNSTQLSYNRGDVASVADPLGNTVEFTRDLVGRLTRVTDPMGGSVESVYDKLDQLVQVTDANGGVTRFAYDAKRAPTSVIDPRNNPIESYETDALGQLLRRTDAKGAIETYEYDKARRLRSAVDRKAQRVRVEYDALDRVAQIEYPDNFERREYDAAGRLMMIADNVGTIRLEYDVLDRLTKETTEIDGRTNTVEYEYDALDRRVKRRVNGGDETVYSYDLASRLVSILYRGQSTTYEWDPAGRLLVKTLPNGIRNEYTYDNADRLRSITYRKSDGSVIDSITYDYDANGRRIAKTTNLPSAPETPFTASYDEANRMTSVVIGGDTFKLEYDSNGNLRTKTGVKDTTTYTWNSKDQLIAITSGSVTASFKYDALGRRMQRVVDGKTTTYVYDGLQAIAESIDDVPTSILTGLAIDEVLVRYTITGVRAYLSDALGSVVAQIGEDQSTLNFYGYSPYGKTSQTADDARNSLKYTAREFDGTGLYYYRMRMYDPTTNRFNSEDKAWDPLRGTNKYEYAQANPITYSDPLGLSARMWGVNFDVTIKRGGGVGGYLVHDVDCGGWFLCGSVWGSVGINAGIVLGVGSAKSLEHFRGYGVNANFGPATAFFKPEYPYGGKDWSRVGMEPYGGFVGYDLIPDLPAYYSISYSTTKCRLILSNEKFLDLWYSITNPKNWIPQFPFGPI